MTNGWNMSRSWWKQILKVAVTIAVIVGLIYWIMFAPVPVEEHQIQRGTLTAEVMGTGTLEARIGATISPKISGRIAQVLADQGERVSKGDVLVRLDDEELRQQVAIAQANVDASGAAIERLTADRERTLAVLEQARKSHARTESLVQQKVATSDDVDRSTEALAIAVAGLSRAEAAITEGRKELVTAEKTLEYHRARLRDTEMLAPFDGLIVKRLREPGDVAVPGSAVLSLISTDELWISAWVDETEMARLRKNQASRVVFRSEPDRAFSGIVVRLGKEADRETREFVVDVRVLELPENWAIGQRAEAFIEVDRVEDVLVLPAKPLAIHGDEIGVFLSVDGFATWRPLMLGLRSRDAVEVMSGLQVGDTVITPQDQSTQLKDRQRVVAP